MEELSEVLKNNRTQDISWLCSLSVPELDLFISLKKLAIHRAEISDHDELADHFDLKLICALGMSCIAENVVQSVENSCR
ncbi:hypothetical protein YC2023_015087 [Brassica napus]